MGTILGILFFIGILLILGGVLLTLGKKPRSSSTLLEKEPDKHSSVFSDLEKDE